MMKIFCSLPKKERPFIKHKGLPNLFVLPYIKGRLDFSELAARAMVEEEGFDFLGVDLPYFMNSRQYLDVPLKLFPIPSSFIIKKSDSRFLLFPFVPNDAGSISVSMARLKFIDFECLDDGNLINYPEGSLFQPELYLKDDYFVFLEGLEGYFSPLWKHMDSFWSSASYMQQWFTSYRASIIVERLKKHLSERKKVLFVCEYQLWWAVKKLLEDTSEDFKSPPPLKEEDLNAALVIENPYHLWAKGLLDDYPCINLKFIESLQEGNVLSFDKLHVLNEVLMEAFSPEVIKENGNPSIRSIVTFMRYLKTRVVSYQRFTPLPVLHLFESAGSCLGKGFARSLAEKLMKYPLPMFLNLRDIPPIFLKVSPDLVLIGGEVFELPDIFHTIPYYGYSSSFEREFLSSPEMEEERRRYWADLIGPSITRQERAEMSKEEGWIRWAVADDYKLHNLACIHVRDMVKRELNQFKVERYWGEMYDGIDWKATLYGRARGEKAIYVRRNLRRNREYKKLDEYTPVTFIFSDVINERSSTSTVHDSNISQRNMELQNEKFPFEKHPKPDMVYSIFMTYEEEKNLCGYDVQRENLSSITFLYTKFLMGVERYEAINRRPKRFQCRKTPTEDGELRSFSLSEIGIAWAVKYAEEVVIVVARSGWKPSGKLLKFAKERHVEIATVLLSILSQSLLERLRHIHFISTPLKKHPESERIVKRFLN
ncbi:MAG: hypothetical protein AB1502_11785 [Thermodesulfobacteriota bacterium]